MKIDHSDTRDDTQDQYTSCNYKINVHCTYTHYKIGTGIATCIHVYRRCTVNEESSDWREEIWLSLEAS